MPDDRTDKPDDTEGKGIFDLFEPPPEIDPNRFGPIPVVPDDGSLPDEPDADADGDAADVGADAEVGPDIDLSDADGDDVPPGEASISSIFGFDPIDDGGEAEEGGVEETAAAAGDPDDATAGDTDGAEVEGAESDPSLPHWTAPPTGVVPKTIAGDRDPADGWSEVSGPRWHGEGPQWAGDDLEAVFADEEGVGGPKRVKIDDPDMPDLPGAAGSPQRPDGAAARAAQRPVVEVSGRNMGQAIGVGIAFAAIAALALWVGKATTLALVVAIAALAAVELFGAMRKAGLHPATLLGIVASGALPLAAYHRGTDGYTLVIALSVVACAMWYLSGADTQKPAGNIGLTLLGITWIGGLAAFASFIILSEGGIELLLATILITVASDTGALAGGKAIGSTPFHSASPNKTWEGTIVGLISAVVAGLVIGLFGISVFSDNLTDAVLLGLAIGVLSPIGDLTESLVKRDLGVKDMGTLLPGHGGFLDRVDGLLFALPGAYYLGNVLGLL